MSVFNARRNDSNLRLPDRDWVARAWGCNWGFSTLEVLVNSTMTRRTTNATDPDGQDTLVRRSWHSLNPFSPSLLRRLPNLNRPVRYTRADAIPDTNADEDGLHPVVRDYHAINAVDGTRVGGNIRVPKKIATPVKVEAKVWFANERSEHFLSLSYACS